VEIEDEIGREREIFRIDLLDARDLRSYLIEYLARDIFLSHDRNSVERIDTPHLMPHCSSSGASR
jgi:hypothetical protein